MSEPVVIEGRFIVIEAGDGVTPTEGFTVICGVNANTFNRTKQTADRFIRDCADPTAVPNRRVIVNGKQVDITATGYFNLDERERIDGLYDAGGATNYRLNVFDQDGVTAVGYYQGAFQMVSLNMGGTENDLATIEISLASNGAVVWTDAA